MKPCQWTLERDFWLIKNSKNLTLKEIQAFLRINKEVIKARCKKLGLEWKRSSHPGRPTTWTDEEDKALIKAMESSCTYGKIAKQLGRTPANCQQRYIKIQGERIPSITLEKILEMELTQGQTEMAISLFKQDPLCAQNYIANLQKYRNLKQEQNA